jgi:peptidoglycan/LPS O-acetylase OafA/YrhL
LPSDALTMATPRTRQHSAYVPALDGIRGLAIIWVVLHNATDMTLLPASGVWRAVPLLTHSGWIGVQLFFALSGFLITGGLLDSNASQHYFRDFYARRALRILPLYYAVLALLLIVLPRLPGLSGAIDTGGQSSLWLFTNNWTHASPYGFVHFWSLAVEEQFYLLWPLVIWKLSPRTALLTCVCLAVGALLLRVVLVARGADWFSIYTSTACRMDALALGAAGACILRLPALCEQFRAQAPRALRLGAGIFLVAIPLTHLYDRRLWSGETWGYSVLALVSALLVTTLAVAGRSVPRLNAMLASAPLRSMGKYSYAMYVFHGLLHKLVGEPWLLARYGAAVPVAPVLVYAVVLLIVSYLLGYCSYQLFERHFLRMKRYFIATAQTPA